MESQILELHGTSHAESLWRRSSRANLAPEVARSIRSEIMEPEAPDGLPWSRRAVSPNRE